MRHYFYLLVIALSFSSTSEAIIINCNYRDGQIWHQPGLYICEASILPDGINDRQVTQITGYHLPGRDNLGVTAIHIRNYRDQLRGLFPRNIETFFPHLQAIRVDNSLNEITRDDLRPFTELVELALPYNNLKAIPRRLFEANPQLRYINMDQSRIHHIAHHIFDHLSLSILRFDRNTCIQRAESNPGGVEFLIFELTRSCPPTTRMIAEEVMESIDVIGLQTRIMSIEAQVTDHTPRIVKLEAEKKSMIDSINFIMARFFP